MLARLRMELLGHPKIPPFFVIDDEAWDEAFKEMQDWCAENKWGLPLTKKGFDVEHFLLKGVPIVPKGAMLIWKQN